jgi:D-alanine-D-alanine ligase
MDKIMTKRIWLSHGLPTPRFMTLDSRMQAAKQLHGVTKELGLAADAQSAA